LQLDEKAKARQDLVFVGLRIRDYQNLSVELNFEQMKLLIERLSSYVATEVKNMFGKACVSRLSLDTLGIVIEGQERKRTVDFLEYLLEESNNVVWEVGNRRIGSPLQACLIHKAKDDVCKKPDVIFQMESLFKNVKEDEILIEKLEEAGHAEERKVNHRDMLDFITYDWEERNKELEGSLKELLETNKRLNKLTWGTLSALARAIDAKSSWTAGHSERVTELALQIGRVLGLPKDRLKDLHRAGLLHDIGKIGTPPEILDKPGKLTDEEYRIICEHPERGMRILEPIEDYAEAVPMVMQHHEWFNGKGYPDGLARDEISLGARILAVADVFDALISERPYRTGMPSDRAVGTIKQGSGSQFDPMVVEAFLKVMTQEEQSERSEPRACAEGKNIEDLTSA
jgi:putative nucleotidyltransferase with HDIG domain